MKMAKLKEVELCGGFWKEKYDMNLKITMNSVWNRFCDTGRIDAFKCDWVEEMENKPHFFWDSDVAKWIEGAAYILACRAILHFTGCISSGISPRICAVPANNSKAAGSFAS